MLLELSRFSATVMQDLHWRVMALLPFSSVGAATHIFTLDPYCLPAAALQLQAICVCAGIRLVVLENCHDRRLPKGDDVVRNVQLRFCDGNTSLISSHSIRRRFFQALYLFTYLNGI